MIQSSSCSRVLSVMKALLRFAAISSFGCCFAAGVWMFGTAVSSQTKDMFLLAAMGLIVIGMAFFAGAILLLAAERFSRKEECR